MSSSSGKPRYCIIGAGVGGLVSSRHAVEASADVTVFEQTGRLGGAWVYTDEVGLDRHGLMVHTSMYRELRTNLPRQVMRLPDWDIVAEESYVSQEVILRWLEGYAEKHDLRKYIKFEHQVIKVTPTYKGSKWDVLVKNLQTKQFESYEFDFIMICNGHYTFPIIPEYAGSNLFKGLQIHSHDYRDAAPYAGKDILLIGAGYSCSDIAIATTEVANSVTVSHHKPENVDFDIEGPFSVKPAVAELTSTGVKFVDGSELKCSVIIYCTGYRPTFPFLSADCGIHIDEGHVKPLYKHLINISHPTMALIGLLSHCIPTQLTDLQARFCIKIFTGNKQLPSKEIMLQEMEDDNTERQRRGMPKKYMHKLTGDLHMKYYEDLAAFAELEPIKPVIFMLFEKSLESRAKSVLNFREIRYEVISDNEFRVL